MLHAQDTNVPWKSKERAFWWNPISLFKNPSHGQNRMGRVVLQQHLATLILHLQQGLQGHYKTMRPDGHTERRTWEGQDTHSSQVHTKHHRADHVLAQKTNFDEFKHWNHTKHFFLITVGWSWAWVGEGKMGNLTSPWNWNNTLFSHRGSKASETTSRSTETKSQHTESSGTQREHCWLGTSLL